MPTPRNCGRTATLLMWISSSTSQKAQNPATAQSRSRATKMWQTARFCSSQVYISRVHGLVNDSDSTSRTPSRSASVPSRSIQYRGGSSDPPFPTPKSADGSRITGEFGVGTPHVERADGVRFWQDPGRGGSERHLRDGAGERWRERFGELGAFAEGPPDFLGVDGSAVADEERRCRHAAQDRRRRFHRRRLRFDLVLVARGEDLSAPRVDP